MRFRLPISQWLLLLIALPCCTSTCRAKASSPAPAPPAETLQITKVDPPNWYATLPKPLLLLRGTGFTGTAFSLSGDVSLRIERTTVSDNGHWAQLWLSGSPGKPETIQIHARHGSIQTSSGFTFAAPRLAGDDMAGFSQKDLIYLILTDRFADGDLTNDGPDAQSSANSPQAAAERAKPKGWHGGDLRGIEQHLDYLQSLGVTAVWPTPVYQNHGPEAYHGYHATDYYSVDPHYGTLADLQSLAAALHRRGMKLILDMVPNHVGPFHPWVTDEPAPDWFHGTAARHLKGETNFDALVDPHAPARDRASTLNGWFVDALPDNNTESPAVAQYLRQNSVWWIEQTGADGLRIDTFPYVDRAFWHGFTMELSALFPQLTEVGEVSNADPEIVSAFADGVTRAGVDTGLYTPFDFPIYHAARDVFAAGQPFTRLSRVLEADQLYPHPERLVPFLGNHDESRFSEVVRDPALQLAAYAFLLFSRGTPQIYAGDEIAMPGKDDPDNRRDFPGGFPGDAADAFSSTGRTPAQQQIFQELSNLTRLRKEHPVLACGGEQVLRADQDTLVWARVPAPLCAASSGVSPSEHLLIFVQRGSHQPVSIDLDGTALGGCTSPKLLFGEAHTTLNQRMLVLDATSSASVLLCNP